MLAAAPPSLLRKQLGACEGLAATTAQATAVMIRLTPRYVAGLCCNNPSHGDNFGKEEYEGDILDALEMHQNSLLIGRRQGN